MVTASDDERIREARRLLRTADRIGAEKLLLDVVANAAGWTDGARVALVELAEIYADDRDERALELLTREVLAAGTVDPLLVVHLARIYISPFGGDEIPRKLIAAALASESLSLDTRHEASLVLALLAPRAGNSEEATMHVQNATQALLSGAVPDASGLKDGPLYWALGENDAAYVEACKKYNDAVASRAANS